MILQVRDDFSGIQNHVKTVLSGLVPQTYGFTREKSEKNEELQENLLPDAFHSPVRYPFTLT